MSNIEKSQGYAITIERLLCGIFKCYTDITALRVTFRVQRTGLGGIVTERVFCRIYRRAYKNLMPLGERRGKGQQENLGEVV